MHDVAYGVVYDVVYDVVYHVVYNVVYAVVYDVGIFNRVYRVENSVQINSSSD